MPVKGKSWMTAGLLIVCWSGIFLISQDEREIQAVSLLGERLLAPVPEQVVLEKLALAKKDFEKNPDEENTIWYGRRLAYAGQYLKAIVIFTAGLEKFPASYRLLRHRGHRLITIRQFRAASADLAKAAELSRGKRLEIEADGIPNRVNVPLSNTQFNIWYHLGLAYYLAGDWPLAIQAYRQCLKWSNNDDLLVAATDWLYLSLRKTGNLPGAQKVLKPIRKKMRIIENQAYHDRLLLYLGSKTPEALLENTASGSQFEKDIQFSVQAYGLGCWYRWQGDEQKARQIFARLLREGNWATFGFIAAEADLARMLLESANQASVADALQAWTAMWNQYDLSAVDRLFLADSRLTYFSSERKGLLHGLDELRRHHHGFGFVAGGSSQPNRLWLEDVRLEPYEPLVLVTATWYFVKDWLRPNDAQSGPVTFVFLKDGQGFRIAHCHFANQPAK